VVQSRHGGAEKERRSLIVAQAAEAEINNVLGAFLGAFLFFLFFPPCTDAKKEVEALNQGKKWERPAFMEQRTKPFSAFRWVPLKQTLFPLNETPLIHGLF